LWGQHSWEWFIHLLETPDSPWFILGSGEKRDDVLICALRLAVEYLKQHLGPDMNAWTWGRLHQLTFRHILGAQAILADAFNLGPFPIGGDGTTVWSSFTHYHDLGIDNMVGPAFRFIADLSDLDHCWGMLAPGQSGHPGSPGYSDGIQPWFKGEYHPMLFKRDEVEKNVKARLILKP
jgi:penicillin amidase